MYLLFFLWLFVLCVSRPRKHYLIQGHKDLLLMFSSQSFIVLTLLFRSVIHSELNLCMVWGRSPMSFFCMRIPLLMSGLPHQGWHLCYLCWTLASGHIEGLKFTLVQWFIQICYSGPGLALIVLENIKSEAKLLNVYHFHFTREK